jgi:hypothetical protein
VKGISHHHEKAAGCTTATARGVEINLSKRRARERKLVDTPSHDQIYLLYTTAYTERVGKSRPLAG